MFKISFLLLIVVLSLQRQTASALLAPSMRAKVDAHDLELTRQAIMAHFDRLDTTTSSRSMEVESNIETSVEMKLNTVKEVTKAAMKESMRKQLSKKSFVPKEILSKYTFNPLKNVIVQKGSSIKKALKNRRSSQTVPSVSVYKPSFAEIDVKNVFKCVSVQSLEEKSLKVVSLLSRIISLGQLEICFD